MLDYFIEFESTLVDKVESSICWQTEAYICKSGSYVTQYVYIWKVLLYLYRQIPESQM